MARKRATDLSKTDMTMLVLIVLLVIFGLAVLFSSSEYNGRVRSEEHTSELQSRE